MKAFFAILLILSTSVLSTCAQDLLPNSTNIPIPPKSLEKTDGFINTLTGLSNVHCEVLIVGGGTGGTAAAYRAAQMGTDVCLTEETDWLGGQLTSQGVSALDEHNWIETFGSAPGYQLFRNNVRNHYKTTYKLTDKQAANPGNCWVSNLCYEPKVGAFVIETMLHPFVQSGILRVFLNARPVLATKNGKKIVSVQMQDIKTNDKTNFFASYFIDATELGDLLPIVGANYVFGAESKNETGEDAARNIADPECVQSFTYPFAVEIRPGENHVIEKPARYEEMKASQGFSLDGYKVFWGTLSFWRYRRLIAESLFNDNDFARDITMINWHSNDFKGYNIIDKTPEQKAAILESAKQASLSFLYWMQTEMPKDNGGGKGYPAIRLVKEVMGTQDGLSKYPYIRESRRIKALSTLVESDIVKRFQEGPRGRFFSDSIGIAHYYVNDIHPCRLGVEEPTQEIWPFQIPLGALISSNIKNLIAGAKNIGTTHITNGATRLHPGEWSIGEAAGALATYCVKNNILPHEIHSTISHLRRFQLELLENDIPLYWYDDVPTNDYGFVHTQFLAQVGVMNGIGKTLHFEPDETLTRAQAAVLLCRALEIEISNPQTNTFKDVPPTHWAFGAIETLAQKGVVLGIGDDKYDPNGKVTRAQFVTMYIRAAGLQPQYPRTPTFSDVPLNNYYFGYIESAVDNGFIYPSSDNNFHPNKPLKRRSAAVWILGPVKSRVTN